MPALAGLGAPHWRPEARGIITGITRGTTAGAPRPRDARGHRALQNADILSAMERRTPAAALPTLKVDGGAAANDLLMQFQADVLGVEIVRPALMADDHLPARAPPCSPAWAREFSRARRSCKAVVRGGKKFSPKMKPELREQHLALAGAPRSPKRRRAACSAAFVSCSRCPAPARGIRTNRAFYVWRWQAQYFWKSSDGVAYAQTGELIPVEVGAVVTTSVDYDAPSGGITAAISSGAKTSSIAIARPFPNESPPLFSS